MKKKTNLVHSKGSKKGYKYKIKMFCITISKTINLTPEILHNYEEFSNKINKYLFQRYLTFS